MLIIALVLVAGLVIGIGLAIAAAWHNFKHLE